MTKLYLALFIAMIFCSCKQKPPSKEYVNPVGIQKDSILEFCLFNATDFDLNNITIGLPDTVLTYKKVEKYSRTEWIKVGTAYNYGFVRFFDIKNRKYYHQPIDYVGETLWKKGKMKFIVKSVDSINGYFDMVSIYDSINYN
ncbi:hypothetical protein [Allomuricauda sp. M10]|uniref:hypothetical protein n=1 Tax=Allomuricauda sp. M10 TaxID=2683292 RepID=UPI001D180717|nr:hypothetical protein [Muricauda sp. M10]